MNDDGLDLVLYVQAQWVLGLLPSARLPEVATEIIRNGSDVLEFYELSGKSIDGGTESVELFEAGLRRAGVEPISKEDALDVYARVIAVRIVGKICEPYDGAKAIWLAVLASGMSTHSYDSFIYSASEYEDREADRPMFSKEIEEEARRIVKGEG